MVSSSFDANAGCTPLSGRHGSEAVVPDMLAMSARRRVTLASGKVLEQREFLRRELNGTLATLTRRVRVSMLRSRS